MLKRKPPACDSWYSTGWATYRVFRVYTNIAYYELKPTIILYSVSQFSEVDMMTAFGQYRTVISTLHLPQNW